MGNQTATITFIYNNGTPQWSVDLDPLPIPQGNQDIFWVLSGQSTPGAAFNTNPAGIVMQAGWPGTTPQPQGNKYRSTENNNIPPGPPIKFKYTVNVLYNGTNYPWDPDVALEPPRPDPDKEKKDKDKDKDKKKSSVTALTASAPATTSAKKPAPRRPAAKKRAPAKMASAKKASPKR